MPDYLRQIGDVWYYFRRVPRDVSAYDTRRFLKISLKTTDQKKARAEAQRYNQYMESFWRELIRTGGKDPRNDRDQYKRVVAVARAHGFAYKGMAEIIAGDVSDLIERIDVAAGHGSPEIAAAVLGTVDRPLTRLSDCRAKFEPLVEDRLIGKSTFQRRKYIAPRLAALENFIAQVGDKPLQDLVRRDILKFREWWMAEIAAGKSTDFANKQMRAVRDIVRLVARAEEIELNIEVLFEDAGFKPVNKSRPPFTAEWVQNEILRPDKLATLNEDARFIIYMMADTGARDSEIAHLRRT